MVMKYGALTVLLGCSALFATGQPAAAQAVPTTTPTVDPFNPLGHFIYPADGQTVEIRQADTQACYAWASEETQFDPFQAYEMALAAQRQANAAGQRQGEVVTGAARGAIGGLIIGAIAGDASQGAAIGAVSGGLIGGIRRRKRRDATEANAEAQQAQAQAQLERWDLAYVVCLQGRKYTVG